MSETSSSVGLKAYWRKNVGQLSPMVAQVFGSGGPRVKSPSTTLGLPYTNQPAEVLSDPLCPIGHESQLSGHVSRMASCRYRNISKKHSAAFQRVKRSRRDAIE